MKTLKSALILSLMLISNQIFALTRISDDALIGIIKPGTIIVTQVAISSLEGELQDGSILRYGAAAIRLQGTSGRKVSLKKGTAFTLKSCFHLGMARDGFYSLSGDLISTNTAINNYSPSYEFVFYSEANINTVGDFRKYINNNLEFYYGEGEVEEIIF